MNKFNPERRRLLQGIGASAAFAAVPGSALAAKGKKPVGRVVVIGAGFGGATAAKYLRKWSHGAIEVVLIERQKEFISCPTSNEVLAGHRKFETTVHSYDNLKKNWGIKVVTASVTDVDTEKRVVKTDKAGDFSYDRLVLSPGFDFNYDSIAGYDEKARETVLHAWKAGPQTLALKKQLEDLPDGGTYVLSIPKAPYRCPPGPYERASLIAHYLKTHKPRSRILILDAKDSFSKQALFQQGWKALYGNMIEWVKQSDDGQVLRVDAARLEVETAFGTRHQADVLNVIPPHRAGDIAHKSGLKLVNTRWVDINWLSMESTSTPGVHVIGDAIFPAPTMPKSGHMANQHGKLAVAAILNLLAGDPPNPEPVVMNTCYSFVDGSQAVHVASVHQYDAATKLVQPVKGAGGLSAARNEVEGKAALAWAKNIWADMLV